VFNIVVNNDEFMGPTSITSMGINITVDIRSASPANIRTIQLDGQGHLFSIDTGVTVRLQDIELRGHSNNTRALVSIGQGTLILNSGAKITGNTNIGDARGGGVRVNGGNLELNDGAEISNNTVLFYGDSYGGGIYLENNSSFIMRGGIFSENINRNSPRSDQEHLGGFTHGGGIYITGNSTAIMHGGIISGNRAIGWNRAGGGIFVVNGSSFTKRAATGSSTSGIIFGGGGGENANFVSSNDGHAIRRNFGALRNRNTTLGPGDEISTGNDVGWE
jgi:hypothetical protein